jgi:valyl-tRNA synthetase
MALEKNYNPANVEEKWYKYWLDNECFKSVPDEREAFTIVIPPPNVTGVLHMGHMLNNTIQDVLIRKARMEGKNACWVPGMDHASIATEAKVVKLLAEQGISKNEIGRDKFLEHAWDWKEKYGGIILQQLKKLGCSCDWDRTRFTMEDDLTKSVLKVFVDLYNDDLIYRGTKMVNWDPQGLTTLSDEEVNHKEVQSNLYYLSYKLEGEDGEVVIATTRPETILGDTAICVNPNDDRYKHLVGKKALIPLLERAIPIIADEYVDIEFGTGCLKVTPCHDENDYNLGKKHNLEFVDIFTQDAKVNEAGVLYVGKDRFEVRKEIVRDLKESGAMLKIDQITNKVGHSERTDAVIEPRISTQWFVDMKKFMKKYPEVLSSVMDGDVKFYPENFKNTYRHWIENIRDWNISRQLWWGQRIPAYYTEDGKTYVAENAEEAFELAQKDGYTGTIDQLRQDDDVLDTWFSSWLWPISVFDGINNPDNEEINYYYPTADLVTGPDIIFFWVARMIMAGAAFKGEQPFKSVYFTGLIRDKQRRKMSKQLGNSPDALELIDKYGADSVRIGLLLSSPAGNDLLFDDQLIEQGRNFCNKIWNAFRLIEGWETSDEVDESIINSDNVASDWFSNKFNSASERIADYYGKYRLSDCLMEIYKLVWDDFCSSYLEMIKPAYGKPAYGGTVKKAKELFEALMKMLHPFAPFITEELFNSLKSGETVMLSQFVNELPVSTKHGDQALEVISAIRNIRNTKNIPMKNPVEIVVNTSRMDSYLPFSDIISKLGNVSQVNWNGEVSGVAVSEMVGTDEVFVLLGDSIDTEEEMKKLETELNHLNGFLKGVNAKLGNEKFVANAKPEIVDREKQKKADAEEKMIKIQESILRLKG